MESLITNTEDIKRAVRQLLLAIGENPDREGLIKTPERIARMCKELFRGYDSTQAPKITTFENEAGYSDMVFDCGDYYSLCEHHILPFLGRYYFAYIPSPNGRIIGISKIARVVSYCAARLQLQERLAKDVLEMLMNAIDGQCLGMAVAMKGIHLCKTMRGIKNKGSMIVSCLEGKFKTDINTRNEFYKLIDMNNASQM